MGKVDKAVTFVREKAVNFGKATAQKSKRTAVFVRTNTLQGTANFLTGIDVGYGFRMTKISGNLKWKLFFASREQKYQIGAAMVALMKELKPLPAPATPIVVTQRVQLAVRNEPLKYDAWKVQAYAGQLNAKERQCHTSWVDYSTRTESGYNDKIEISGDYDRSAGKKHSKDLGIGRAAMNLRAIIKRVAGAKPNIPAFIAFRRQISVAPAPHPTAS